MSLSECSGVQKLNKKEKFWVNLKFHNPSCVGKKKKGLKSVKGPSCVVKKSKGQGRQKKVEESVN